MAAPDTFTLTTAQTVFNTTFGKTSVDQLSLILSDGTAITSGYTVDGVGDGSASLVITWPDAVDHAGKTLTVDVLPQATMLSDFATANAVTPKALQNEFEHLYGLALQATKASGAGVGIGSGGVTDIAVGAATVGSSAGNVEFVLGAALKVASGTLNDTDLTIHVYQDGSNYGVVIRNYGTNTGTVDWEFYYSTYPS